MTGPRILSLEVENFRSIGGGLKIDLSAPLTILVAANGTGKTSLCAAGQWLLTGEALDQKVDTLGNKLSGGVAKVRGEVDYHGGKLWIEREKSTVSYGGSLSQIKRASTDALLGELFANIPIGELTGAKLNRWVFGTRWLYANDLAILVDSDAKSVERRNDVFADLFGVRHLQDTERKIDSYHRATSSTFEKLNTQLNGKQKELGELDLVPSVEEGTRRAEEELALAANALGAPVPAPDLTFPARVSAISMALQEFNAKLSLRQAAVAYVDANEAMRNQAEAAIQTTITKQNDAKRDLDAEQALVTQMKVVEDQARVEWDRTRIVWEMVSILAVNLKQHWDSLLTYPDFRPADYSLHTLEQAWPMCTWEQQRRVGWTRDLDRLRGRLAGFQMQATELASCRADREALADVLGEPAFENLQASAAANAERVRELERELHDISGPIERLRLEGHAALDLLVENACPLCGKLHNDLAALRDAIRHTLEATPAPVVALQDRLGSAREDADRAATALIDERRRRQRMLELDEVIRRTEPAVVAFHNDAAHLDITLGEDGWEATLAYHAHGAELCEALAAVLSSLRSGAALIGRDLSNEPLTELYQTILRALREFSSAKQADVNLLAKTAEEALTRRLEGEQSATEAQARLDGLSAELAGWYQRVEKFDQQWSVLSAEPWLPDRLAHEKSNVAADIDRATTIALHLDIAQKMQQATLDQQRRNRLLEDIAGLKAKVKRLEERRDTATRLRTDLEAFRANYVSHQFEALRPMVEAFFLRMHANRFLTELQMGQDGEPLRWMAAARGTEGKVIPFDTSFDLSSGQQQDLALAFFLSRACILGGSFFLDEPLVHLDDLNRVAVLDILRMIVLTRPKVGLVLTTANRALVRHIKEKFSNLSNDPPLLRIIELDGNPQTGVRELIRGRELMSTRN